MPGESEDLTGTSVPKPETRNPKPLRFRGLGKTLNTKKT